MTDLKARITTLEGQLADAMQTKEMKNYVAVKNLTESQARAVTQLETENTTLKGRVIFLETQMENADKTLEINRTIMTNIITTNQQQGAAYAEEIKLLKAKILELEG